MIKQFHFWVSKRYSKELEVRSGRVICIPIFMAALLQRVKSKINSSAHGQQINKLWYAHTMKYYLVSKRKKILTQDTAWVNLKDVMLNVISQPPKKTNTIWFHLYHAPSILKFIETESKNGGCQWRGTRGKWGLAP